MASLLLLAACRTVSTDAHPLSTVAITRQSPAGLPLTIRMTNGTVELTIVPDWGGRIMRYGYVGEPNVIWNARSESLAAGTASGWANRGGDKSWVWPQADWQSRTNQAWPPPKEFDDSAWSVVDARDGAVTLLSPPLPRFENARLCRQIELESTGTRVVVRTELVMPSAPIHAGSKPIAAWEITQVVMPVGVVRPATQPAGEVDILEPRLDGQSSVSEAKVRVLAAAGEKYLFVERLLRPPGPSPTTVFDKASVAGLCRAAFDARCRPVRRAGMGRVAE